MRSRRSHLLVWLAFLAVHAGLVVLGVAVVPAEAFWDVDLYRWWAGAFLGFDEPRPVLDAPWVYPAGALGPVVLPGLVTVVSTPGYALAWSAMVTLLDAVVVAALLRRGATTASLWWLALLLALGPVALGRLDAVAVPLATLGLLAAADAVGRPAADEGDRRAEEARSPASRAARRAATLLTAGAWVKVAPGPLLLPLAAAASRPWRDVVGPAAVLSAAVVGTVLLLGGAPFSFLVAQTDRGLQAESVAGTPWVLGAALDGRSGVAFDEELVTYEVVAPAADAVAGVLDVLLPAGLAVAGLVLVLARHRGAAAPLLLPASLVLTVWLVVANKVGSPQFVTWLAAPVVVMLAGRPDGVGARARRAVAVLVLVVAALTQAVFPWGYPALVTGDPAVTLLLATRNAALVGLLVVGVVLGVRAASRRTHTRRTHTRRAHTRRAHRRRAPALR